MSSGISSRFRLRAGATHIISIVKASKDKAVYVYADCQRVISLQSNSCDNEVYYDNFILGAPMDNNHDLLHGMVPEVLIYSMQLDTAQNSQVSHYLASKFDAACVHSSGISISGVALGGAAGVALSGADTRGEQILIRGSGFGLVSSNIKVNVGSTACSDVVLTSRLGDEIICQLGAGVGRGLEIVATVAGSTIRSGKTVHYRAPLVSAVTPSIVRYSGGETITIVGNFFGSNVSSISIRVVSTRDMSCTNITLLSNHTRLSCQTPVAVDEDSSVVVVVQGQESRRFAPASMLQYRGAKPYYKALAKPLKQCHDECVGYCIDQRIKASDNPGLVPHECRKACCNLCGC